MESLPVELLHQIFSSLCFHCQNPGVFPNADLDHVLNDKKALAHLCRTSKYICSIAQPILYHYYATGNTDSRATRNFEYDFLPQFIRTIAQRPDLASQITTMHLVENGPLEGYDSQIQTIESLIEFSISKNLLEEPCLPDDWCEGRVEQWCIADNPFYQILHCWLATLAVVLSPRFNSLYLDTEGGCWLPDLEDCPHIKLLSLQTLGLMSHAINYFHDSSPDTKELCLAASNIKTIYVHNAYNSSSAVEWFRTFKDSYGHKSPLSNAKRLAISHLHWGDVKILLRSASELEEFELYWEENINWVWHHGLGNVVDLLDLVKATLNKLCIGWIPRSDRRLPAAPSSYRLVGSLYEYPKLEYLSIDCFLLYNHKGSAGYNYNIPNRLVDIPNQLVDFLPQRIRFLRISYVYGDITKSLRQLVADAPDKFPFLKEIVVGIFNDYENCLRTAMSLEGEFEASGIKFTMVNDSSNADLRTLIPGDVIGSRTPPIPRIRDMLEKEAEESV
ncbi:hypothetical protein F5Y02DRAFT_385218 [Annulohypoxylon stygium]|nr:hypothetical protein F5Y02DRAFT_385218 [Annulohypoxylon stygium]